uniref:Uncharacterized protein n=1 Tax=Echeneis naucrates TaxID=173247 RepID=A0A665UG02_ECHNA
SLPNSKRYHINNPVVGGSLRIWSHPIPATLPHKSSFSRKYGSVFTVYLGPKKVVVLAGYQAVKEALVGCAEEFGEREIFAVHGFLINSGIVWANGDSWKEMRRFALTSLKDFGMGKKASENKVIEECDKLTELFMKSDGETVDVAQLIQCATSNVISSLVYGNRFQYDDPEFISLVNRATRRLQLMVSPSVQMYNLFPRLCQWIPNRREFQNIDADVKKQNLMLFRQLKETLNPQMCRGLIDAFLMFCFLQDSGITDNHFHDENLLKSITNLFSAGTDTTATTVIFGLQLLAKNLEIQDQVREELNRVVRGRQVVVGDRKNLPFTNAVMHEIQRMVKIAPMGIPHRTAKDVTFHGYFIEKGTVVYPLLASVLLDETEWERPYSFYPAHFLDKDGNFVKRDAFLPFSAGRRVCLGEGLARMEVFIFLATILQRFSFSLPAGVSDLNLCAVSFKRYSCCSENHSDRPFSDIIYSLQLDKTNKPHKQTFVLFLLPKKRKVSSSTYQDNIPTSLHTE